MASFRCVTATYAGRWSPALGYPVVNVIDKASPSLVAATSAPPRGRELGGIRLRQDLPAKNDTHDCSHFRENRSTTWIIYQFRLRRAGKSFKDRATWWLFVRLPAQTGIVFDRIPAA